MFYNKNKNTTELIEFINFINENNIELLEKPSKNKNTELKEIKTEKKEIKTISLIENLEIKEELLKSKRPSIPLIVSISNALYVTKSSINVIVIKNK